MMKLRDLGLLVILLAVTACAPVHYQASYRQAPVYATHGYAPFHHLKPSHTRHSRYRPIQITLFAGSAYAGRGFQPIHVVIADGDYVEIPAQNRRGRSDRIFAHYAQGNLHFDAKRKCQILHGSSRYEYDRRWDKGHSYQNIHAGNNFDFTGLRLQIRNVSSSVQKNTYRSVDKPSKPDTSYTKITHKQLVRQLPVNHDSRQVKARVIGKAVSAKTDKPDRHITPATRESGPRLHTTDRLALKGRPDAHETKTVQVVQQQEENRPDKVKARKKKHDRVAAAKQSDQDTDHKRVKASGSVTEEDSAGKSLLWIKDQNRAEKRKPRSLGKSEP